VSYARACVCSIINIHFCYMGYNARSKQDELVAGWVFLEEYPVREGNVLLHWSLVAKDWVMGVK